MKPPAFQFYADDFLSGTCDMTCEEVGAYIRLLCYQWSKGSIPSTEDRISIIVGECQASSLACAKNKFGMCEDGLLRNARMEHERAKQSAFRDKQSKNAAKRWEVDAKPDAKPDAKRMPNVCSPSPSPSPNKEERKKVAPLPDVDAFELHPKLNTPAFKAAWKMWLDNLKQRKKTPTIHARDLQLAKLSKFGHDRAIQSINNSIENGWQGLFEPRDDVQSNFNPPQKTLTDAQKLAESLR